MVHGRILVVDDSTSFRRSVERLLRLRGFHVISCVPDGASAVHHVGRDCPDGVLLDVNLPDVDGFAVATLLSTLCPAARIVLTSAEVGAVPRDVLDDCHAIAFVPKDELAGTDLGHLFWG